MSTVFVGELPGHGVVAVKVIAPHLSGDDEYRRRLRREVDALRRVDSPRVAPLIDADVDADEPWLAMGYLDGPTLRARVVDQGPLPEPQAAEVADQLAEGLVALHRVGVVHRDLTPTNVILTADGGAVIVDLGIARLGGGAPLTRTGTTLGTPAWMAPEQLTGASVGPPADVFAWGGVVTFAATGRAPFGEGDPAAMGYRIVHTAPELTGVADGLSPIVAAALAPEPGARPAATTLRQLLSGEIAPTEIAPAPTQIAPAPTRAAPTVEPPAPVPPSDVTTVARNRSTSTPSLPTPPGRRRAPHWPWTVLAVVVVLSLLLVVALMATGGGG